MKGEGGLGWLRKAHDLVSWWGFFLAGAMIVAMSMIMTYEVVVRYFFNSPTTWVLDFSGYLMVYSTFLAAAWILKQGGHISISFLSEKLGPRGRAIQELLIAAVCLAITAVIIWQGLLDVWDAFSRQIDIVRPVTVPKYLVLVPIPLGMALMLLYFLRQAGRVLARGKGV